MSSMFKCPYGHEFNFVDKDVLRRNIGFCMQCQETYMETREGWIVIKLADLAKRVGVNIVPPAIGDSSWIKSLRPDRADERTGDESEGGQ